MQSDHETDRIVQSWLDEGRTKLPGHILDAVLDQVPTTRQRRSWWLARRTADIDTFAKLAIAAAAVVVITVVGMNLLSADGRVGGSAASPSPTLRPSPSRPSPGSSPDTGVLTAGRKSVSIDGVLFSLTVPPGWESFGWDYPNYISKSTVGPQGAEGVVFWTGYPPSGHTAEPCHYLRSQSIEPVVADLAAAVSAVPGTDLLSEPSDMLVGGLAAKHVVIFVREDVGCDPGFFFTYPNLYGGALWPETVPGDTVTVWIVDAGGTLLFIEAKTHEDADAALNLEIEQIVNSIQFE